MTTPATPTIAKGSLERRIFAGQEIRVATEGGKKKLSGYSARFNRDSEVLGGWFVERILPGCFTEALKGDVRCLFNHDSNQVLGRTKSRTLSLVEDSQGLLMECEPPDTAAAGDVIKLIDRGDVSGQSFSFITLEDRWTFYNEPGKPALRELVKVELYDVGPVTFPAYPDTDVAVRSREFEQIFRAAESRSLRPGSLRSASLRLAEAELA